MTKNKDSALRNQMGAFFFNLGFLESSEGEILIQDCIHQIQSRVLSTVVCVCVYIYCSIYVPSPFVSVRLCTVGFAGVGLTNQLVAY